LELLYFFFTSSVSASSGVSITLLGIDVAGLGTRLLATVSAALGKAILLCGAAGAVSTGAIVGEPVSIGAVVGMMGAIVGATVVGAIRGFSVVGSVCGAVVCGIVVVGAIVVLLGTLGFNDGLERLSFGISVDTGATIGAVTGAGTAISVFGIVVSVLGSVGATVSTVESSLTLISVA